MKLFIDDLRDCPAGFLCVRSSFEAIDFVKKNGMPSFISFDHDLGGEDTSMIFLKWLANNFESFSFEYAVHSANPIGKANIVSFLESWRKSLV